MDRKRRFGILMVVIAALGFASVSIFIKYAYAAGANSSTILTFRFLFAAPILWTVAILTKQFRGQSGFKGGKLLLACGLLYGLTATLYTLGLRELPVALAVILFQVYPVAVLLIAFMLGDDQLTVGKIGALIACIAGLILVLEVSLVGASIIGVALGLGAAMSQSAYVVVGNRALREFSPIILAAGVCSVAAGVSTTAALWGGGLSLSIPIEGWIAILGMAVIGTALSICCYLFGVSALGPSETAILSVIDPLTSVVLSTLLLGETLGFGQMVGGMLILCSVVVMQMWPAKAKAIGPDLLPETIESEKVG
ncbi:MAG: DMT family transporter [Negativicutes bacterium]